MGENVDVAECRVADACSRLDVMQQFADIVATAAHDFEPSRRDGAAFSHGNDVVPSLPVLSSIRASPVTQAEQRSGFGLIEVLGGRSIYRHARMVALMPNARSMWATHLGVGLTR